MAKLETRLNRKMKQLVSELVSLASEPVSAIELTDSEKEVARRSKIEAVAMVDQRSHCGYKRGMILVENFLYGEICPTCNGTGRIHPPKMEQEG